MSQFAADPSWSFLKITNGVLSLARQSLNDIETQYIKHDAELVDVIHKLSKSLQQTNQKEVHIGSDSLPLEGNGIPNECKENDFKDAEQQPNPKSSKVRKKKQVETDPPQISEKAAEPCTSLTPDESLNVPDASGIDAGTLATLSESGDLNHNLPAGSNDTVVEDKPADIAPKESVFSPIINRTRSRRKVPTNVVVQLKETRSRRKGRKQEPAAEVEATDSTQAPSAEIASENLQVSDLEANASKSASQDSTPAEASKVENVLQVATRPKPRRGRKAAPTRTTRQRKKATSKLTDNEETKSTIVEGIDLKESTKIAEAVPTVEPSPEEIPAEHVSDAKPLAENAAAPTVPPEINRSSPIEIDSNVDSSSLKEAVVVDEDHSEPHVSPALRPSSLSANLTPVNIYDTSGSQNSSSPVDHCSDLAEVSVSSPVQQQQSCSPENRVDSSSLSSALNTVENRTKLPMEIVSCNVSVPPKSLGPSSNSSAPSVVVLATPVKVHETTSQSIPSVVLPQNIQTAAAPRQPLLQSLLDDDNMSDSDDMEDEPPVTSVAHVAKVSVDLAAVNSEKISSEDRTPNRSSDLRQSNFSKFSVSATGPLTTPQSDHAAFPYRFIPPSDTNKSAKEAKPTPPSNPLRPCPTAVASPKSSAVVPAPIKPPSFLTADNQPLFSLKSKTLKDSQSNSSDNGKKSTPPVSGVLQSLLMQARADSMRRQCSENPVPSNSAVAGSPTDCSNKATLSTCKKSEVLSAQQSTVSLPQCGDKAATKSFELLKATSFSTTGVFSSASSGSCSAVIRSEDVHHLTASESESADVAKSSSKLTSIESASHVASNNQSGVFQDKSVPSRVISSSDLGSSDFTMVGKPAVLRQVGKSALEKLELARSADKLELKFQIQASNCPELLKSEAITSTTIAEKPSKYAGAGNQVAKHDSLSFVLNPSEDLSNKSDSATRSPPRAPSHSTRSTTANVASCKPPPITEDNRGDISKVLCHSNDFGKITEACIDQPFSTVFDSDERRRGNSVSRDLSVLPHESCSNDVVNAEDLQQVQLHSKAFADVPVMIEMPLPVTSSEVAHGTSVAKIDTANVEQVFERKHSESTSMPTDLGNLPINSTSGETVLVEAKTHQPASTNVDIRESVTLPKEEQENELDDDMEEVESLAQEQFEAPEQPSKSGSVWDSLYNGFTNISTNVASFVRPKVAEPKTKRVVEVKALKIANAKRKRDLEREEEIKLRNKKLQEAGEERKRKALQDRKDVISHAAADASSASVNTSVQKSSAKNQDSHKRPAERLVELSTEERRKRAEERRQALEEEERRKRQEKEEQRQQQREGLKKRRKEEEETARKKPKVVEESLKKLGAILPNDNTVVVSKDKDSHKHTSASSSQHHRFAIPQAPAPRHTTKLKPEDDAKRSSDPVVEIPTEADPSDCEDDEESDEKDAKKIPKWAQGPNLLSALAMQASTDPDTIFNPDYLKTCDLTEIFTDYSNKTRFTRRTSSGNWLQDRLGWREELEYKRRNGFLE